MMNDTAEVKERYRLLIQGDSQDNGYLEELKKQAEDCAVTITSISPSEMVIEGENRALAKLFLWLLDASRLEKVRYLKSEP